MGMLLLTSVILAATSVHAFPRPQGSTYLIPSNVTITPYAPSFRTTTTANNGVTDCEVGGATVVAQDLDAGPGESPQAFSQLWDWVENEVCTELGCSFGQEYCVTASTGQDVCIEAQGSFPRENRADFLRSARGAFDRSVIRQEPPRGVIETGTSLVHIQGRQGPYGGGDVRVQLRNQGSGGDGSCPRIVETIAAGGSLIPQIAAPFGVVTFLCGTADRFSGTATG